MQLSLAGFTILYAKFLADSLTRKLIMVWSEVHICRTYNYISFIWYTVVSHFITIIYGNINCLCMLQAQIKITSPAQFNY